MTLHCEDVTMKEVVLGSWHVDLRTGPISEEGWSYHKSNEKGKMSQGGQTETES